METALAAAAILSPLGLVVVFAIATTAILLARGPSLSAARLIAGYVGALLGLALLVVMQSYVSPEDAVSVWHVPTEHYRSALLSSFVNHFAVEAFLTVIGISLVGLPVLSWLSRRDKGTAPWLILSSIVISIIFAILLYLGSSTSTTLVDIVVFLIVPHTISTIGFAVAAGLRWKLRNASSATPNAA
jgi:hypothetical protein